MTKAMLLEIINQVPPHKMQTLCDFARYLAFSSPNNNHDVPQNEIKPKLTGFESETEMLDYINDVGKAVYAS
jgi:hypothetical protein